jgi:hypothetical protein
VKHELLWFPGCPNWQEADARLREALTGAGIAADVVLSCRMFPTPDGLRRAPTVGQLVAVLRAAA